MKTCIILLIMWALNAHAYMGYVSNRFLPFLVSTPFTDNGYQWGISNIGVANVVLSNGNFYVSEQGIAGVDCRVREAWALLGPRMFTNKICVISTGVATNHPDLTNVLPGVTITVNGQGQGQISNGQTDSGAGAGEGTAVAGIIAGSGSKTNDDGHICGIVPGAKILPINAQAAEPSHTAAWNYALTNGAKIILMEWGYGSYDWNGNMQVLMQRSLDSNVVVVQAAPDGQGFIDNTNSVDYPGSTYPQFKNIIAATALSYDGTISEYKGWFLVAAPARRTVSTGRPSYSTYVYVNGTSFGAPTVAGAVALVWAAHPTETAVQICDRVRAGCDPLDQSNGSLNIAKSICMECPVIRPAFQPSLSCAPPLLKIGSPETMTIQQSPNLKDWTDLITVTGPTNVHLDLGTMMFYRAMER